MIAVWKQVLAALLAQPHLVGEHPQRERVGKVGRRIELGAVRQHLVDE